ncbi:MAG: hypothetical protein R2706_04575 [Acidimicrobiales bacterium]
MPKQGDRDPWQHKQDYFIDKRSCPRPTLMTATPCYLSEYEVRKRQTPGTGLADERKCDAGLDPDDAVIHNPDLDTANWPGSVSCRADTV